jgi:flagellar biosynthetic protein FliQ
MNEADLLEITRESILVLLQISGPMMVISLVVGVGISLFQTLTQIQEQTISFVPKIVIMFVSLLVLLPFMIAQLTTFTERIMDRIISIG